MKINVIVIPIIVAIIVALLVFQPGVSHAGIPPDTAAGSNWYRVTCSYLNRELEVFDVREIEKDSDSPGIIYFRTKDGYLHVRAIGNCKIDEIPHSSK